MMKNEVVTPIAVGSRPWGIALSPDGSKVFVTGASPGLSVTQGVTVAYDATTGTQQWVAQYDGPAHLGDIDLGVAVNPAGTRVFVTGYAATLSGALLH